MITVKIRITADSAEDAELIRAHLERTLAPGLKLAKARQGSNPKYADDPKWLAYGTLTLADTVQIALPEPKPGRNVRKKGGSP
ncbi:MAG: hypothetical protein AB4911_25400 [Oscillochloridaceae bacterium umkhey_bin13]